MATPASQLIGRDAEIASLAATLDGLADGGAAFLLRGDPGIGKTSIWRTAEPLAGERGLPVLVARPAEDDAGYAFATLGDLLDPVLDEVADALPAPQRSAIDIALLRATSDDAPDARAVALGVLGALRAYADRGPFVIAIDDAQWADPDSARALGFAFRRLAAMPVAVVAAYRPVDGARPLVVRDLPDDRVKEAVLGPLDPEDIARLLRDELDLHLPPPVTNRIAEASGGNPFHALEFGRALDGRVPGAEEPLPVSDDLDALLRARLDALPAEAADVLPFVAIRSDLTVSQLGTAIGDPSAAQAGIDAAVTGGVIQVHGRNLRFTHSIVGEHVRGSVPWARWLELHARMAEVVDDPDERLLHRALATTEPDEAIAAPLADLAGRQHARGAPEAAAATMEQAVQLTPDRDTRADRIVSTARHLFQAGDVARARTMLEDLVESLEPGPRRGRARHALAELDWIDPGLISRLAEETLADAGDDLALQALALDELGWCLAEGHGSLDRAIDMADRELQIARELDDDVILAFALSAKGEFSFLAGDPAWDTLSAEAVEHERRIGLFPTYTSPRLARGWQLVRVGRFDEADAILLESLELLHRRGQVTFTWQPLWYLAELEWRRGNWDRAEEYVTEGLEVALGTGVEWARMHLLSTSAVMLSLRGRLDDARTQALQALAIADRHGQRHSQLENRATLGFVELSAGDPRAAADHMAPAVDLARDMGIRDPGAEPYWPDILLAFAAADRADDAHALAEDLEARSLELDRPWAVSIAHLGYGLVADAGGDHETAIAWYDRAIEGYEDDKQYVTRGWTYLALGRARRASKQKRAAREAFEEAKRLFAHVGAPRWIERADEELARISGVATSLFELTPTERRIAELVATGRTNREVAQELFLSIKTVEANLSRIYSKLGISSRRELAAALTTDDRGAAAGTA